MIIRQMGKITSLFISMKESRVYHDSYPLLSGRNCIHHCHKDGNSGKKSSTNG